MIFYVKKARTLCLFPTSKLCKSILWRRTLSAQLAVLGRVENLEGLVVPLQRSPEQHLSSSSDHLLSAVSLVCCAVFFFVVVHLFLKNLALVDHIQYEDNTDPLDFFFCGNRAEDCEQPRSHPCTHHAPHLADVPPYSFSFDCFILCLYAVEMTGGHLKVEIFAVDLLLLL